MFVGGSKQNERGRAQNLNRLHTAPVESNKQARVVRLTISGLFVQRGELIQFWMLVDQRLFFLLQIGDLLADIFHFLLDIIVIFLQQLFGF